MLGSAHGVTIFQTAYRKAEHKLAAWLR